MVARKLMYAAVLSVFFLCAAVGVSGDAEEPSGAGLRIVYNNIPGDPNSDLTAAGGFGAWVDLGDGAILFDAGGDTAILAGNLREMNLDPARLDAIVISHNHWDHVYGLPVLLGIARFRPEVHVPQSARTSVLQQNPRASVVEHDEGRQIRDGLWTTGSMKIDYFDTGLSEQALVIKRGEGIYILTGCAHPGVVRIVEKSKALFPETPIMLVAGGFHLRDHGKEEIGEISAKLRQLGVRKIGPSHCTGDAAIEHFRGEWKDDFVRLYLGDEFRF